MKFRKAAKIPYPYMSASYEQVTTAAPARAKQLDDFNRAQRGHHNLLENLPTAIGAMLITGLVYPKSAAVLGAAWSVGRLFYAWGYNNGKPEGKGRYNGAPGLVAHYVLLVWSAWTAALLAKKGF